MFPYYKTDHGGVKKKSYNQKLLKLGIHPLVDDSQEETYVKDVSNRIFDFLAEKKIKRSELGRDKAHPIRAKWDRHNRYYWANLMNAYFTRRGTIEYRLHGPTVNPHKMINWLFICVAIIRYAEANASAILQTKATTIPLENVLNIYKEQFPKNPKSSMLSNYLIAYFQQRRDAFKRDLAKNDHISMWDINNDKDYTFEHKGVKGLV